MIQIQRVLVPTDFSDFSQHALRYGCEFAERFGAELHLLNVVEDTYPLVPEPGLMLPTSTDYVQKLVNAAHKHIQSIPSSDQAQGLSIVRKVVTGVAFLEVIRYSREQNIDLIVIGTHGRSGLVQVLMGSVAEKVVRKAPCPVLSVRPAGHNFVMP